MSKYQVVWVDNLSNTQTKHGVYQTEEEAMESIRSWWKQNNFKPLYVRSFKKENTKVIDYGLHYYFYNIVELD